MTGIRAYNKFIHKTASTVFTSSQFFFSFLKEEILFCLTIITKLALVRPMYGADGQRKQK